MKIELYEKHSNTPLEIIADVKTARIETIGAEIQILDMLTESGKRKAREIDSSRIDLLIKD